MFKVQDNQESPNKLWNGSTQSEQRPDQESFGGWYKKVYVATPPGSGRLGK